MSFRKFQLIDPHTIGCPESGHIYLGRDEIGLWEKYSNCEIVYILTGTTIGSGTSGTSGSSGKDGVDGEFFGSSGSSGIGGSSGSSGISGSSGKSGATGISGSNGTSGSSGNSGTSGKDGASGTSGTSGTSGAGGSSGTSAFGSSGTSGNSGSSGISGLDGAYGGATRMWKYVNNTSPNIGEFHSNSTDLASINELTIYGEDFDNQDVSGWLSGWTGGLLKIENWQNPSVFGIYDGCRSIYQSGRFKIINMLALNSNSNLVNNNKYLISFIKSSNDIKKLLLTEESVSLDHNFHTIIVSGLTDVFLPSGSTYENIIYNIKRIGLEDVTILASGSDNIYLNSTSIINSFILSSDGYTITLHYDGIGYWYVI